MALGDRLVSGVPTGLVGKQRAKKQQGVERQRNYLYCERQQNRTEQNSASVRRLLATQR